MAVNVRAGGLQQRFSYRVEAVPDAGDPKKRVLVLAAEDYTGVSPNRGGPYDVGPRYLQHHVDALTAAGYEVETFNVDAQATYQLSKSLTVTLQALNLTDQYDDRFNAYNSATFGNVDSNAPLDYVHTGRTFMLGVRYKH